jgi:hypothetical protein
MRRVVRRLLVVAACLPFSGAARPSPLAAQIVRGPTYTSSAWNAFTLTAWTADAGHDTDGNALYRHWFTGALTVPALHSFGSHFNVGVTETFYLAPWAYGDPSAPPNPYAGCDCFTYGISGPAGNGWVVAINTRWTMGTIRTTIPGFVMPQVQEGSWGYQEYLDSDGRLIDQDVFGDLSDFFVTADAPAPDPYLTPEPATLTLFGTGVLGLGLLRRRQARTA